MSEQALWEYLLSILIIYSLILLQRKRSLNMKSIKTYRRKDKTSLDGKLQSPLLRFYMFVRNF